MAIQFGTVDGLVNITTDSILCFAKGIDEFVSLGGPAFAKSNGVSLGTAFQRFIDPVYSGKKKEFALNSVLQPVLTRSGAEQSPARVTFCKKMGLLIIDEQNDLFEITPLGKAILDRKIYINEYAFVLLSKMGVFKNETYLDNLLSVVSLYFQNHPTISQALLGDYIKTTNADYDDLKKTRLDIIINALAETGLITKVANDIYVLSGTGQAELFLDYYKHSSWLSQAELDTSENYGSYIGNLESGGVFDILSPDNVSIYTKFFPNLGKFVKNKNKSISNMNKIGLSNHNVASTNSPYISALRTKPFMLLAGISGTGKSQKVQELAFMTCPKGDLREEGGTTPGNYCLIEVKPNWHDSTELLGYYSALSGKYELTDFIRFVYKAIQHDSVPFFLCLDEMNLAPVEQYLAEYLSVLETRRVVDGEIKTQCLLTKDRFSNCDLSKKTPVKQNGYIIDEIQQYEEEPLYSDTDKEIILYLKNNGLTIPSNLFVIGTVNMDDTTHQFSRKVIDRAFTIEMNGGKMSEMFANECKALLEYREDPIPLEEFKPQFVHVNDVFEDTRFARYKDIVSERIPELLGDSDGSIEEDNIKSINGVLNNTPFRVSYRVQNELVLYLSTLIERAGFPDNIDGLIIEATLAILLEKVLPRIQGEQKQLETKNGSNILKDMKVFVGKHLKQEENDNSKNLYTQVVKKLTEMDNKLDNYYTNFF